MTRTFAFILSLLCAFSTCIAQDFLPEKRIYLLDVTASMAGVEGNENVFDTVKVQLRNAILDTKEDPTSEVVVIPFAHKAFPALSGDCEKMLQELKELPTYRKNTNITAAWEVGLEQLDSTKLNYLFLLTDGSHNFDKDTTRLHNGLRSWNQIADGKPYYAFYLMLTQKASKDQNIRAIANEVNQMWNIESLNVNATFAKTTLRPKTVNVFDRKIIKIPVMCNHLDIILNLDTLNVSIPENYFYAIDHAWIEPHPTDSRFAMVCASIIEKRPKIEMAESLRLPFSISFDRDRFPLVFFTPEVYDIIIKNKGKNTCTIDRSLFKEKQKISGKFKEGFLGFLSSRPKLLTRSLDYYPFKWFVPDTLSYSTSLAIDFNDECRRFGADVTLGLIDKHNRPVCIDIECNGNVSHNGQFKISLPPRSTDGHQKYDVKYIIPPSMGECDVEGSIVVLDSSTIDEVAGLEVGTADCKIATLTIQQEIGYNWMLWFCWIITLLLIVAVVALLLYALFLLLLHFTPSAPNLPNLGNQPNSKESNGSNANGLNNRAHGVRQDATGNVSEEEQRNKQKLKDELKKRLNLNEEDMKFMLIVAAFQTLNKVIYEEKPSLAEKQTKLNHVADVANNVVGTFNPVSILPPSPSPKEILKGKYPKFKDGKYEDDKTKWRWPYISFFDSPSSDTEQPDVMAYHRVFGLLFGTLNLITGTLTQSYASACATYRMTYPSEIEVERDKIAVMDVAHKACVAIGEEPKRLSAAIATYMALKYYNNSILKTWMPTILSWKYKEPNGSYYKNACRQLKDCDNQSEEVFLERLIKVLAIAYHQRCIGKHAKEKKQVYQKRLETMIEHASTLSDIALRTYVSGKDLVSNEPKESILDKISNLVDSKNCLVSVLDKYE